MKKVLEFIKKIYSVCKNWVVSNGVEGVLGLLVGLVLWIMGYKIWAGFSFGVFATRNWDILKAWVMSKFNK
jgi:phosphatidylglycerophosphatase A